MNEIRLIMDPNNINVLCMTLFWLDGYDPNTSSKGNRKGAWAGSRTFILYNLKEQCLYSVDSTLFVVGPGKGNDKDDHTKVFQQMLLDNQQLFDDNGTHRPLPLISRYHQMKVVNYYICHLGALMDNPERRSNFGLLQGNSRNHGVFGISCFFDQLVHPFQACVACGDKYIQYIDKGDWTMSPTNITCVQCYGYSLRQVLTEGKYFTPIKNLPDSLDAP